MNTATVSYQMTDEGPIAYRIGRDTEFCQFHADADQRVNFLYALDQRIKRKGMELVHTHSIMKDNVKHVVCFYAEVSR